jgi:hypothetical protein
VRVSAIMGVVRDTEEFAFAFCSDRRGADRSYVFI